MVPALIEFWPRMVGEVLMDADRSFGGPCGQHVRDEHSSAQVCRVQMGRQQTAEMQMQQSFRCFHSSEL